MEQGTYWIGNPSDKVSTFKTEAFYFLASSNAIYVECLVRVCLSNDTSQECVMCGTRKRRDVESRSKIENSQIVFVKTPVFYIIDKGLKFLISKSSIKQCFILSNVTNQA